MRNHIDQFQHTLDPGRDTKGGTEYAYRVLTYTCTMLGRSVADRLQTVTDIFV